MFSHFFFLKSHASPLPLSLYLSVVMRQSILFLLRLSFSLSWLEIPQIYSAAATTTTPYHSITYPFCTFCLSPEIQTKVNSAASFQNPDSLRIPCLIASTCLEWHSS